jgi:pyruvate kinase
MAQERRDHYVDGRRTKIVATIGPACDAPGVLGAVIESGIDVARLNASHGSLDDLGRRFAAVRASAERCCRHVAVMVDLPGPKVRLGEVAPGTVLVEGSEYRLVPTPCMGDADSAWVTYEALPSDVSIGDRIMVDDGAIELGVLSSGADGIVTRVVRGGPLASNKGVNVPGVRLRVQSVTQHDLELLAWALEMGADLVAQSFVRSAGDVDRLRAAMGHRRVPIVAKIEKHEAIEDLAGIIAAADGIMVARGDLAVETSPESVPPAQRRIIEACRVLGKPVVVATQMLESMVDSPRPTRAEASDVATAVFEGADAVMLSEETAIGHFPVEAVCTMDRICRSAEAAGPPSGVHRPSGNDTAAVAAAACDLATAVGATVIVTPTETGTSARAVAACRPGVPVLALTPIATVGRALSLVWGVSPQVVPTSASIEDMTALALRTARASGVAAAGDRLVLTAGTALGVAGSTDLVRVLTV